MAAHQNKVLRLVQPSDMGRLLAQGLVDLYKAVKGASFYPSGHPYRTAPLQRAFEALAELVEKRDLVLTVGRQGFVPAVEAAEGNVMVLQLAQECLMRRISSITFTQDLIPGDLEAFAELLGSDPHKSASFGGFSRQLWSSGVRTVRVQEKDRSPLWPRRGAPRDGSADAAAEDAAPVAQAPTDGEPHSIGELLTLMAHEELDARYQELGRELVQRFPKEPPDFAVLPVLEELLRQHQDAQKSLPQREYALFTLERLSEGSADLLLDSLESRECPEMEGILRVLAALGGKGAYRIIQRLCLAQGVFERKALARALVRLGPAAIAPVMAMLKDERWYVVRNMVTILGELRAREAVAALQRPLYHEDERVRKEAVRALMKIGGEAAEATLISVIEDDNVIGKQAIQSLGLMRSSQSVAPLVELLERRDLLLKQLGVKKEVALALGRIGDRRATPALLKILRSSGLPVVGRWRELKVAAASALGVLGDEAALAELASLSKGSGSLAEACREAIEAIERVSGREG